jgi:hypothetical protein
MIEILYLAVSVPVLARLRIWDLFDPSKTTLLGNIMRLPCAIRFVDENSVTTIKPERRMIKYLSCLKTGGFFKNSDVCMFFYLINISG